jgi:hypothetical protein
MRALAVLLLVPGFTLGLVAGLTNVVGTPRAVSSQSTDLVWSDRVFTSRADFAAWLEGRGSDYEVWAERHPAAAGRFEDPARLPLASQSTEAVGGSVTPRAGSTKALLIASVSFALLLAMLALSRVVRSARYLSAPSLSRRVRPARPAAAVLVAESSTQPERVSALGQAPPLEKPRPASQRVAFDLPWRGSWSQIDRLRQSVTHRLHSPGLLTGGKAKGRETSPVLGEPTDALAKGQAARLHWQESWNKIARLGRVAAYRAADVSNDTYRVLRHYLPRVTFYAIALFLSFAIGASVAIYLK